MIAERLKELHNLAIEKNYPKLLIGLNPFIYKLVKQKYRAGSEHEKDLIQCGRIGLYNAMQTYDPEKSNNFFTHAHTHIKSEILLYLVKHKTTVRLPAHQLSPSNPSHNPNRPTEIITSSLSLPAFEYSSDTQADLLESDYYRAEEIDDKEHVKLNRLKPFVSQLRPKYQKIISMRYFEEKTYSEIAFEIGMSKEGVRQQLNSAIGKLKKLYKIN